MNATKQKYKTKLQKAYAEWREERKQLLDLHSQLIREKQLIQNQPEAFDKEKTSFQEEHNMLNEKVAELTS